MMHEQTRPIVAFCAVSVLAVGAMVSVANRPPETRYEAGPLPEPISEALSPDFLLGDLLDAREAAAERKAERRAEARRKPRFVLPFHSAAPSAGHVARVAAPTGSSATRGTGGARTTRTTTTTSGATTGSTPTASTGPRHRKAPGRAKHDKPTPPGHAHRGSGKAGKRATTTKRVETRRLSLSGDARPGGGHGKGHRKGRVRR